MTGKRFEAPRPAWNILKRLGQLADGYDPEWKRISSPLQPVAAPPDLCPGKIETGVGRPVSVAALGDYEVMP